MYCLAICTWTSFVRSVAANLLGGIISFLCMLSSIHEIAHFMKLANYSHAACPFHGQYTVDHTFGYPIQKFIRACTKLSAHAHGTEIRSKNFKGFKTFEECQGHGQFATNLQSCIQT